MNIILHNTTEFIAQFVVKKGDQVVACVPEVAPNTKSSISIEHNYEVTASTMLGSNALTSMPIIVTSGKTLLAEIQTDEESDLWILGVRDVEGSDQDQLEFQSSCINPVTFMVTMNGVLLKTVVVNSQDAPQSIEIGEELTISSLINGVCTPAVSFIGDSPEITACENFTKFESSLFSLTSA